MAEHGVYVIVIGHNQEAKCDVANALIHQEDHFKPFACRENIMVESTRTVCGKQLFVVATPKLNTPAWTHGEKAIEEFKLKIFLYIKDNDLVDSDDQWSFEMLNVRFGNPVMQVQYILRKSVFTDTAFAAGNDIDTDAFPIDEISSTASIQFHMNETFELKRYTADVILKEMVQLLETPVKQVFTETSSDMAVDDQRKSDKDFTLASQGFSSETDISVLNSVTISSKITEDDEQPTSLQQEIDDNDRTLFRKTLRVGKAKTNHIRVNIVGNQGAGKTTLVKRLQEKDFKCPDRSQPPTEGLAINQINTRCIQRGSIRIWETNPDGYESESNLQRMAFALKYAEQFRDEDRMLSEAMRDTELGSEECEDYAEVQTSNQYGTHIDIQQKERYLKRVKRWRETNQEDERMYLSYWDFAGQSTYYSTHQAFMAPSAVYVLVIDLSQDLSSPMKDSLKFKTHGILKKYTVEETVKFWISSIKAYTRDDKGGNAPFIVVGTHKDKVTEEQMMDKFDHLRKVMRKTTPVEFIAIDNTQPLETNDGLKDLRNTILDFGLGVIDKDVPAQWIDLEYNILQEKNKGKTLLSFKDVQDIDAKSDMPIKDPNSLRSFLDYQHSRGWLIHFCHIDIKDIIILDPCVLANFFNTLLRERHFDLPSAFKNKNGIIHQDFIDEAATKAFEMKRGSPLIREFTSLLVSLHIMHRYKENKYFVPCLLPHRDRVAMENNSRTTNLPAIKLRLSFKDAFVPPAFYHLLIGALRENRQLNIVKEGENLLMFNLYVCFTFQRDTLWLETYWDDCSVFFELTNYSETQKIVDSNCNKILDIIDILYDRVQHVLDVFRQTHTKYTFRTQCPRHQNEFVDLQKARECGEAMCIGRDPKHHKHAVSWDEIIRNRCIVYKEETRSAACEDEKPTDKMLGRLARQLSRENPLSMTSKLSIKDTIADQATALPHSVEMQRLYVLDKWVNRNPEKTVVYLLQKFTETGGYDIHSLASCLKDNTHLTDSDLTEFERTVSQKELSLISDCIGAEYAFLMLELDLSITDVNRYTEDSSDLRERVYRLLELWRAKNADKATVRKILEAAKYLRLNYTDMISKLKGALKK